jgi:hypothetical protein
MRMPIVIFFVFTVTSVSGQYDKIPGPDFENQSFYFDKSSDKLVQLEKTTAKMKSKFKLMGYGGSKSSYQIKGEKSTTVITTADTSHFVQSGADMMMNMMDSSKFIMLYKLTHGKGIHEAVLLQTIGFSRKEKESAE